AKTNDHSNLSASVTKPEDSANRANWAFETAHASIQKLPMRTSRTGPSPSSGYAQASSAPIAKDSPPRRTIPSIEAFPAVAGDASANTSPPPWRDGAQHPSPVTASLAVHR